MDSVSARAGQNALMLLTRQIWSIFATRVAVVSIAAAACVSEPAKPPGASDSAGGGADHAGGDSGGGGNAVGHAGGAGPAGGALAGGGAGNAGGAGGKSGSSPAPTGDAGHDIPTPPNADAAADPTTPSDAADPADGAAAGDTLASCPQIVGAASAFIAALEPAKKATAVMRFEQRKHYLFTPEEPRPGLPLRDMSPAQQEKALALLKASLSDGGYQKAMLIRTMDNWLKAHVGQLPFGNNNYFVAIYGTPSPSGTWAWHWEGHHASIHFTFAGCTRAASTPAMFGVEPATLGAAFEGAPAGTRVLGRQEDLGRSLALLLAADPVKKAKAIAGKGGRMLPNTPAKQAPQSPVGLPVAMMNPAEVDLVKQLLAEVAGNVNPELAAIRLAKIQAAGFDKISFYWAGPLAAGVNAIYYFRVQGPTFIFEHNIEWENHIHSAWRDFDGDFGEDLLQQHLLSSPHRSAQLYQQSR
jgi:hypothetical protein